MYKYIKEKLPSSFYGIVSQFVGPDGTQSFESELLRNKYLNLYQ